jgi:hypothetical protein
MRFPQLLFSRYSQVTVNKICYSVALKTALLKFLVHSPLLKFSGVFYPFFVKSGKKLTHKRQIMWVCPASWITKEKETWNLKKVERRVLKEIYGPKRQQ